MEYYILIDEWMVKFMVTTKEKEEESMGILDSLKNLKKVQVSDNSGSKKERYFDIVSVYSNKIVYKSKDGDVTEALDNLKFVLFDVDNIYHEKVVETYPSIAPYPIILSKIGFSSSMSELFKIRTEYFKLRKQLNISKDEVPFPNPSKKLSISSYMVVPAIVLSSTIKIPCLIVIRNNDVIKQFADMRIDESSNIGVNMETFDETRKTLVISLQKNDYSIALSYDYTQTYNKYISTILNQVYQIATHDIYKNVYNDFIKYGETQTETNMEELKKQIDFYANELKNQYEYELNKLKNKLSGSKGVSNIVDDNVAVLSNTSTKKSTTKKSKVDIPERTQFDDEFDKLLNELNIDTTDDDDDEIPF